MTSVTHAAAASTILPGRRAHAAPSVSRFRIGADSKAVRMGLGVAIAAVLAGDLYAVLRSPISEGATSGQRGGAASAATADSGAHAAVDGGYVATNPFGEAAYSAELASRFAAAVASTGTGAQATAPAPALTPPALSTPTMSTPLAPVSSFVPPVGGPANPAAQDLDAAPPAEAAAPGLLAPVVKLVPQAAPVAAIVEGVVDAVPASDAESAPASTSEVLSVTVDVPPAVTSGLSL